MEICGIQGSGCLWIVCDHYGFGKPSVCCVYKVKDTLDFTYFNTADIIGISWKGLVQCNADISDLESVFDGYTVLSYSLWL